MSGIIGSKFNHRGSGVVAKAGTDGQHLLSSGAGKKHVFETVAAASTDLTPVKQDIAALAIHAAIAGDKIGFNLPNTFIDHYESDAKIGSVSNTDRNDGGEFIAAGSHGSRTATTYTSGSGNFTVPDGVYEFEILVVGGGGGGAGIDNTSEAVGGGGGGGIWHKSSQLSTPTTTFAYVVGAGGTAVTGNAQGNSGATSTFTTPDGTLTAIGGGGGSSASEAKNGANGGGQGRTGNSLPYYYGRGLPYWMHTSVPNATPYGGHDGGLVAGNTGDGGGGGGAGAAGQDGTGNNGGDGGVGILFSNYTAFGGAGGGGSANGYFGGGGGGGGTSSAGDGGNGGGGNGGSGSLGISATAGTGGGGGGSNANGTAGAGGSGFIGLSYLPFTIAAAGTLISSAMTVEDAKTEISGVMVYRDFAGTATIGTDLKIEGTCNGGTNYTEFGYDAITPLDDTNLKMVRLDKTTFTSGTDIRYRLTFANQSDGSKETHVYGVGLAY